MSEEELHVFLIEDGGERFWFVASDEEDAFEQLGHDGLNDDDHKIDEVCITRLDDDMPLRIFEEDKDEPDERSCGEWCKEGRRMLGATVF